MSLAIILAVFIVFFYGPLLNMVMLAFADKYDVPNVLPQDWGFKWWGYIFSQKSLVSSMIQSFIIAIVTTLVSMVFCIPAAYSIARFKYRGRKLFMLSFLLTNAFPKLGIYTSVAVLFYRYRLMGTYTGVVIIHMINSMMFMVWLPASAFRSVHRQQEEAVRDVGAGRWKVFTSMILPLSIKDVIIAATFVWMTNVGSFTTPYLMGGTAPKMLGIALFDQFNKYLAYNKAAALSVIMFLICAVSAGVYIYTNLKDNEWEGQ